MPDAPRERSDQERKSLGLLGCGAGKSLKGHDNQRVSNQHGGGFIEGYVQRWTTSSKVCIIEAREVVMHERGTVNELQRRRSGLGHARLRIAEGLRDEHGQLWSQPRTAREYGVTKRRR
jgi:hypothetical protein